MSQKPFEFDKHLRELEDITSWFESKDANLDEGITKFERGMELAQQLKSHLADVENRVEKIRQKFDGRAAASVEDTSDLDAPAAAPESNLPSESANQAGLFGN